MDNDTKYLRQPITLTLKCRKCDCMQPHVCVAVHNDVSTTCKKCGLETTK